MVEWKHLNIENGLNVRLLIPEFTVVEPQLVTEDFAPTRQPVSEKHEIKWISVDTVCSTLC